MINVGFLAFLAKSIVCWVPLDSPSQNAITSSQASTICLFRLKPADLPYSFQSGKNSMYSSSSSPA